VKISQELEPREELILGVGRPFDQPYGDADAEGIGRDVVSNKTERSDNGIFTLRHAKIVMLLPKTALGRNG